MEKITICIIDKDETYKTALMEFMKSYCRNYVVSIPVLENAEKEQVQDVISSNDILLISYDYLEVFKKVASNDFAAKTIVLLESFAKWDEKHTEGLNIVSKYTDIKKIINYIDNHYYELNSSSVHMKKSITKLVICLGLSGGSGVSSISEGIASELSKYRGRRVFFFSLDQFEPELNNLGQETQERIIYSLINNDFSNDKKIFENSMVETADGVWRMPVSSHRNVFYELELKEKKKYIKEVTANNKFDYIVIDCGNRLDEFADYLIGNSDDIIIVDAHMSIKNRFMTGLIDFVNEVKMNDHECILVENFMESDHTQTYESALPISCCQRSKDMPITGDIKFCSDIKNIVDYIG